jgi:hypothetical protein
MYATLIICQPLKRRTFNAKQVEITRVSPPAASAFATHARMRFGKKEKRGCLGVYLCAGSDGKNYPNFVFPQCTILHCVYDIVPRLFHLCCLFLPSAA